MPQTTTSLLSLQATTERLLEVLDARSRDIISRRYGLINGQVETLESIGKEYGITRERVRQIQSQGKKALLEMKETLLPVIAMLEEVFSEHGGILTEEHATVVVRERTGESTVPQTVVVFYLDLLPPYRYITRDSHFAPHWRHPEKVNDKAVLVVDAAAKILERNAHPMTEVQLLTEIYKELQETPEVLPQQHIIAQLLASNAVNKTPFGEWGLIGWPETNPRGVGDKAYAVLRRHGKPEHFTRITELINEAHFDYKTANPQTVHNELIKDRRFVLVGRGLYGLREWGYVPGTVADVIVSVMEEAQRPLSRNEIITLVLSQRQVKKNTILLGLQNHKKFVRTTDNKYSLKK